MKRIIGFVVTFGILCMMFFAFSSSTKQAENMVKNDPQYIAHREMLKAAGVNPDDPKAVEAYMLKLAEDIRKSQESPAGVAKE